MGQEVKISDPVLQIISLADNNLREFVKNYRHLDSRRVSGWFRTALRVPDPGDPRDPRDPARLSNLLEFEDPSRS